MNNEIRFLREKLALAEARNDTAQIADLKQRIDEIRHDKLRAGVLS